MLCSKAKPGSCCRGSRRRSAGHRRLRRLCRGRGGRQPPLHSALHAVCGVDGGAGGHAHLRSSGVAATQGERRGSVHCMRNRLLQEAMRAPSVDAEGLKEAREGGTSKAAWRGSPKLRRFGGAPQAAPAAPAARSQPSRPAGLTPSGSTSRKRKRRSTTTSATHASVMANWSPMHLRAPPPAGRGQQQGG